MKIDAFLCLWSTDKSSKLLGESLDQVFGQDIAVSSFDVGAACLESEDLLNPGEEETKRFKAQYAKFGFKIEKEADRASPLLFQAFCLTFSKNIVAKKNYFPHATVTFRKAGGDKAIDYLVMEFLGVIVTSYSLSVNGEGATTESVGFRFKGCQMQYTPQAPTGGELPAPEIKGWDYRANTRL